MEIKTLPYNIDETLRTPDVMAVYLEACTEETDGDAAFIAKASTDRTLSRKPVESTVW